MQEKWQINENIVSRYSFSEHTLGHSYFAYLVQFLENKNNPKEEYNNFIVCEEFETNVVFLKNSRKIVKKDRFVVLKYEIHYHLYKNNLHRRLIEFLLLVFEQ